MTPAKPADDSARRGENIVHRARRGGGQSWRTTCQRVAGIVSSTPPLVPKMMRSARTLLDVDVKWQ